MRHGHRAPRNYVGLSCSGHDSALAIVDSRGEVVFAEAAERHLQNKRAFNAPPDDMLRVASLVEKYCEDGAELVLCKTWSDCAGAIHEATAAEIEQLICRLETSLVNTRPGRTRKALDFVAARTFGYRHLAQMYRDAQAVAGRNLSFHFRERVAATRGYDHHLTHAANGCFTSPFTRAACLVIDGMGEGVTVNCYTYGDGRIVPLQDRVPDGVSSLAGLGLFYADLCSLCGFDHWKGEEWKVMGLAAYGRQDARLRAALADGLRCDGIHLHRSTNEVVALAKLWHNELCGEDTRARAADLARAGQEVFEAILIQLCQRLHELTGADDLVFVGGCALNSSANGKLTQSTGFRRVYVPCAPADDGNALGAALLAYFDDHPSERPRREYGNPYLGSAVCLDTLHRAACGSGLAVTEQLAEDELCDHVATRLCAGQLVGWMHGRAEFGPRALGNRSILADPRRAEMKDRINEAVKFRESFRPFAPAILARYAAEYFEAYQDSPYMERALSWRPHLRHVAPAAVHADGTGRLQTVTSEFNPRFHALLSAFHRQSGVPILVNTSFNVMGKPIVHSVEDAMALFMTSALDVLVIEDRVFAKR